MFKKLSEILDNRYQEVGMKIRFVSLLFLAMTILWGCKTDKTPTSAIDDPDPNGEEELLKVFKDSEEAGVVKVMSRNVYIGTDVDIVLDAPSIETIPILVASAFDLLEKTDFPSRAEALATEIEKTLPHLIGLQEMSKFFIQSPGDIATGGEVPATDKFLDLFEVLMAALEAKGLEYEVVATVENADVELPMFVGLDGETVLLDDVRIIDHDVILARSDVVISNSVAVRYDSMLVVEEAGFVIPRGYVAVNAQIGPTSVVFANTHIEAVPDIGLRMAQVSQLLDAFAGESLPVIIVGDFNSQATTGTSYNHVLSSGYTDTWIENPLTYNANGYTFGHESNLKNDTPNLFTRIDFIFTGPQGNPTFGEGFVLGDEIRDKTENGLWPSDHAGVVTKLTYALPTKLAAN
jgi:endonuclease/exonuclease/phosphatase family metal-dependent hydrolase